MKKHLFLICLISILIYGCSKPKVTYYPINAQLKAAFNYQVGTYWIYRDSISGREDSFYVIENNASVNNHIDKYGGGYTMDFIAIEIKELNISPLPISNIVQYYDFGYFINILVIATSETKIYTGNIQYCPMINYPYHDPIQLTNLGGPVASYSETSRISNIYNTFNLNGTFFNNTIEVNHSASIIAQMNYPLTNPYSYSDDFFISPDAGIIKMRLNHPQDTIHRVWELERYKIVK